MLRVLIFGDSIEYGAWDPDGGWVDRVKREAHKQTVSTEGVKRTQVFNLGVGGNTSRDILARIKNETEARLSPAWDLKIVLSFGANDSRTYDGAAAVPIDEFKNNACQIINIAKEFTKDVLVVGNPPLSAKEVAFKTSVFYDDLIKEYDETLAEVAANEAVPFVSIRDGLAGQQNDLLYSYDKVHMNEVGHELIKNIAIKHIL